MKTRKFKIEINASREKVWKILWDDDPSRKWTSVFSEGSHAVTDWKEGSKIQFIDSSGQGMYSIIDQKAENSLMMFKHLGELIDGVETERPWAGARETYRLTENGHGTELAVEMDAEDEHEQYFAEVFPKALNLIKQLSEQ